jgi:hypothetical protein
LVNPDGSMMRGQQIDRFARRFGLLALKIADVIAWRTKQEVFQRPFEGFARQSSATLQWNPEGRTV